jgi:hypothetical protein
MSVGVLESAYFFFDRPHKLKNPLMKNHMRLRLNNVQTKGTLMASSRIANILILAFDIPLDWWFIGGSSILNFGQTC